MGRRKRLDEHIEIKVTITRREFLLLKRLAEKNNMGPYEYGRNILRSWLKSQMLGRYRTIYEQMKLKELAEFFGDLDDDGKINYATSAAKKLRDKLEAEEG